MRQFALHARHQLRREPSTVAVVVFEGRRFAAVGPTQGELSQAAKLRLMDTIALRARHALLHCGPTRTIELSLLAQHIQWKEHQKMVQIRTIRRFLEMYPLQFQLLEVNGQMLVSLSPTAPSDVTRGGDAPAVEGVEPSSSSTASSRALPPPPPVQRLLAVRDLHAITALRHALAVSAAKGTAFDPASLDPSIPPLLVELAIRIPSEVRHHESAPQGTRFALGARLAYQTERLAVLTTVSTITEQERQSLYRTVMLPFFQLDDIPRSMSLPFVEQYVGWSAPIRKRLGDLAEFLKEYHDSERDGGIHLQVTPDKKLLLITKSSRAADGGNKVVARSGVTAERVAIAVPKGPPSPTSTFTAAAATNVSTVSQPRPSPPLAAPPPPRVAKPPPALVGRPQQTLLERVSQLQARGESVGLMHVLAATRAAMFDGILPLAGNQRWISRTKLVDSQPLQPAASAASSGASSLPSRPAQQQQQQQRAAPHHHHHHHSSSSSSSSSTVELLGTHGVTFTKLSNLMTWAPYRITCGAMESVISFCGESVMMEVEGWRYTRRTIGRLPKDSAVEGGEDGETEESVVGAPSEEGVQGQEPGVTLPSPSTIVTVATVSSSVLLVPVERAQLTPSQFLGRFVLPFLVPRAPVPLTELHRALLWNKHFHGTFGDLKSFLSAHAKPYVWLRTNDLGEVDCIRKPIETVGLADDEGTNDAKVAPETQRRTSRIMSDPVRRLCCDTYLFPLVVRTAGRGALTANQTTATMSEEDHDESHVVAVSSFLMELSNEPLHECLSWDRAARSHPHLCSLLDCGSLTEIVAAALTWWNDPQFPQRRRKRLPAAMAASVATRAQQELERDVQRISVMAIALRNKRLTARR